MPSSQLIDIPVVAPKTSCMFLHGLASSSTAIAPLKPIFENLNYPCFIPQLLGHRKTLPMASEINLHNWELELDCLIKYITQNLKTPIILGGQSFGAILAINLASKYPTLVKGLILFSPSIILRNNYQNLILSMLKFCPNIILKKIGSISKSSVTDAHRDSKESYSLNVLKHLSILRCDALNNLKHISLPIFVAQSSLDYHLKGNSCLRIQEIAKNSRVKTALRDFGPNHNLSQIPETKSLVEEGLNFICQEK